jgi:hypothetical protein
MVMDRGAESKCFTPTMIIEIDDDDGATLMTSPQRWSLKSMMTMILH